MKSMPTKLYVIFAIWIVVASLWRWAISTPQIVTSALYWSWPVLLVIGIIVSVKTLLKTGMKAYWFFILYFVLALYESTGAVYVNQWIREVQQGQHDPEIKAQEIQIQEEISAIYRRHNIPPSPTAHNVAMPIGQLILVTGMWFVAKKAPNHRSENTLSPE
jgi:Zn-dependent protease with chaperone function